MNAVNRPAGGVRPPEEKTGADTWSVDWLPGVETHGGGPYAVFSLVELRVTGWARRGDDVAGP